MLRALFVTAVVSLVLTLLQRQDQPAAQRADMTPHDSTPPYQFFTTDDGGRRMRGDWEPPDVVVLSFAGYWPEALADLAADAARDTDVEVLVDPSIPNSVLNDWFADHGLTGRNIDVSWVPVDTAWVRDFGPLQTFDADGRARWLDALYTNRRPNDDQVPQALGWALGVPVEPLPFELDGGALVSDGAGLCVSTLDYFSFNGIEAEDPAVRNRLTRALGCRELLLVPSLSQDETMHADMFAQFLGPSIVAVGEVDPLASGPDAERLDIAAQALERVGRRLGGLTVVRVPLPYLGLGEYRTYVNGLHLKARFLVPSYRDVPPEMEAEAFAALSRAMPSLELVPVPADDMIRLAGALHCVSLGLTLPARKESRQARADARPASRHIRSDARHRR